MKVSVALCTYNGERFLRQQLESVVAQTRPVDEIVICDDGSTDRTAEILRSYAGRAETRIVYNPVNLGFVKNFEKALGLTTGGWVFLCDQDDIWLPKKVEAYLRAAQSSERVGLIFGNAALIDESGASLHSSLHDTLIATKLPPRPHQSSPAEWHQALLAGNFVTGATVALKRDLLASISPFPNEVIHDYWASLCTVLSGYSLAYVEEPWTMYRIHPGQNAGIGTPRVTTKRRRGLLQPDRKILALDKALVQRFTSQGSSELSDHKARVVAYKTMRKRLWASRQRWYTRFAVAVSMLCTGEYESLYRARRPRLVLSILAWARDVFSHRERTR